VRYFKNRTQAGRLLAEKIIPEANENYTVVALSEGGVLVGAEIAKKIHSRLYILTSKDITMPREIDPLAAMSSEGTFTYNSSLSAGQLEELTSDYRTVIDQERLKTFQELNRIVSNDGVIDRDTLKDQVVILASDGLKNGLSLDVAADYLKPIKCKKIIVTVPIANVSAIDRMHLLADQIYCLGAVENYFSTDHYYEENVIPDHKTVVEIMKNIVLNW
jgi:predicted phosphoribosyltransferase